MLEEERKVMPNPIIQKTRGWCLFLIFAWMLGSGLSLVFGWPEDASNKKAKKAFQALEGQWVVKAISQDGEESSDPEQKLSLKVTEGRFTFQVGEAVVVAFEVSIDLDCTPHLIDLTPVGGDNIAMALGMFEGIYELKEDRLRICLAKTEGVRERPDSFEAKKDSKRIMLALQRSER